MTRLDGYFRRFSDREGLPAFVCLGVLGSKQSKPQTRKFGAGATPFALALVRVNVIVRSHRSLPFSDLQRSSQACVQIQTLIQTVNIN